MSRLVAALVVAGLIALAAAGSASAWQYKFQDFFDFQGGAVAAAFAKAKKCSGGKLGTYDYVSRVVSSGDATDLEVEVEAELSVREEFRHMKHIAVSATSSTIDPTIVNAVAQALQDFHETVFTRWKPGRLEVKHGSLVIFGNEVVAPGESKTPFHPKPGC